MSLLLGLQMGWSDGNNHTYIRGCDIRRAGNEAPEKGNNITIEALTDGQILTVPLVSIFAIANLWVVMMSLFVNRTFSNIYVKQVDGLYMTNCHMFKPSMPCTSVLTVMLIMVLFVLMQVTPGPILQLLTTFSLAVRLKTLNN